MATIIMGVGKVVSMNWERSQSTILKTLEVICGESNSSEIKALIKLIDSIEKSTSDHLSNVSSQLPGFDKHDISHCYKLIENIEKLLDEKKLYELDPFELFLIYTSCLLHDAAMALPQWEYTLLECCEGQEGFNINNSPVDFLFDEKPTPSHTSMANLIEKNKDKLYNYTDLKGFLFPYDSESDLISDLAERATAYIEYRNGFDSLSKMRENGDQADYKNISEDIRCHFIRDTHHKRVERYIKTLKTKFADHLGGLWAKALADDLGLICRSHGEAFDFVQDHKTKRVYFQGHEANIPFICTLLRLSDILHFSYDRAPLSLFAEKQITDRESRKHWLAKLQGVSYEIKTEGDLLTVVYSAYCEDPDSWYFLRDYIKGIETEIQNYHTFYRENQQDRYSINIKDKVDSDGINYNADVFTPDDNLHFTLDQNRILELLMGVNLYKDKYLCLRELYQNSLDACRVMRGHYPNEEGMIEFGIGSEKKNGKECRYVYCLDNGSGMDKEIIVNHFLRIGNSYYNSPSFRRQNLNAKERFNPVSRFGIGVLSCFMIGDILDITTQSMIKGKPIRFIVNGPNEHFYYTEPDRRDLDLLAGHGTLVKLFLKSNEKLNDVYPGDKEFFESFYKLNRYSFDYTDRMYFDLFNILQSYIFYVPTKINFSIKTNCGLKKLFDVNTQISDIYNPDGEISFWDLITDNVSKTEIQKLNNYHLHKIEVEHNGIVYYNYLAFPVNQNDDISYNQIHIVLRKIINPWNVLNEGITVDNITVFIDYLCSINCNINFFSARDKIFCFCFDSEQRLELSADRTAIINIPDKLKPDIEILLLKIAEAEINYIWRHITNTGIPWDSDFASTIWTFYLEFQYWNIERIINAILKSDAKIYVKKLCDMIGNVLSLGEIMKSKKINFSNIHLTRKRYFSNYNNGALGYFTSILIYHTHEAILKGDIIEAELDGNDFPQLNVPDLFYKERLFPVVAINAYDGKYAEYDFVNSLFPFIPHYLFDKITVSVDKDNLYTDNKKLLIYDSTLIPFFHYLLSIDARTIYPEGSIYCYENIFDNTKSKIGHRSSNLINESLIDYIHFKYNNPESPYKEKTIFYCYYCPEKLTEEDEKELEYYKSTNPKYVEGILNGWSVLLLGGIEEVIVEPRIAKKSTLLKRIDNLFWEKNSDTKFYFPDGTPVTKEYIDALNDG
jgi:hypothetical protein